LRSAFNRRIFLNTVCGAVLAPQLGSTHASEQPIGAHSLESSLRSLGESLRLPRRATQLAGRFRAMQAHARQPNHLLAQLRKSPQAPSPRQVAESFAQLRAQDFRMNHIVIIDGWVLARTEVELCELLVAA
jgi:hypothetical protein